MIQSYIRTTNANQIRRRVRIIHLRAPSASSLVLDLSVTFISAACGPVRFGGIKQSISISRPPFILLNWNLSSNVTLGIGFFKIDPKSLSIDRWVCYETHTSPLVHMPCSSVDVVRKDVPFLVFRKVQGSEGYCYQRYIQNHQRL